jgi:transposase InsO family protein
MALTGKIMTAYVERVNLTLREHIPALSRRTWSLTQSRQSLEAQLEWGRAYYHFCRYHESFRVSTTLSWVF